MSMPSLTFFTASVLLFLNIPLLLFRKYSYDNVDKSRWKYNLNVTGIPIIIVCFETGSVNAVWPPRACWTKPYRHVSNFRSQFNIELSVGSVIGFGG